MIYQTYIDILKDELIPAMGCTEPIAVAYAGALARDTLGKMPEEVELTVSGNIVKNVKSVIVPHTGGRKGLRTAVAAGIALGRSEEKLEVLAAVTEERLPELDAFLGNASVLLKASENSHPFDIGVRVAAGGETAYVRIMDYHTNVVLVKKNDEVILDTARAEDGRTGCPAEDVAGCPAGGLAGCPAEDGDCQSDPAREEADEGRVFKADRPENESRGNYIPAGVPENRKLLTVEEIVRFADEVRIEDICGILDPQIRLNMKIAEEGLKHHYGAGIGRILLRSYGNSVHNRAKAWAAAGSDARMSGCEMPVVINSGSGNQGITASVPVIIYARECGVSDDLLYRALVVSNLITIHLKSGIGSLSAYCGAVSAGAGAGAGICYLYGGGYEEIAHTVVNAIAINSGMICDGAKASCAAKIASAVEAGLLGMEMYRHDSEFKSGDGIVVRGVENTIAAVSSIARDGMRETDDRIIQLMMEDEQGGK